MPKNLLKKCLSVFSKYPPQTVRDLGKEYMKLYQLLHANEKPVDITNTKPFENTENLKTETNEDLIYLRSRKIEPEDI